MTVFCLPAAAQTAQLAFGTVRQDTALPVEMDADSLRVDQSTGTAVFTGNVHIKQGVMQLDAQEVLVIYRSTEEGIERLEATGGVTLTSGQDTANAQRADYDIDAGTLILTGDVAFAQGSATLSAQRMTIRLNDGTAEMTGRVKTTLTTGGN